MQFTSPTWGKMNLDEVCRNIQAYMSEEPNSRYKMIIGTDSQTDSRMTVFVTALVVHRTGKGARFYFHKEKKKAIKDLRYRIYRETHLSLQLIEILKKDCFNQLVPDIPLEVHIDIGQRGETKNLIQEIVGWVTSVGYEAKIKPHAFGASAVADRFTS